MYKCLDLFCKAGGSSMGYYRAGFAITGVDIKLQKHYPFEFICGDALEYLKLYGRNYDFIAASPPCQKYTRATKLRGNIHPDYIESLRDILTILDKPYVIENVVGAPLINPIILMGTMFNLKTIRPRLFESNIPLIQPNIPPRPKQIAMGRPVKEGDYIQVVGHFSNIEYAKKAMGIDWMTGEELREAIPPAYTEFIGKQILEFLDANQTI